MATYRSVGLKKIIHKAADRVKLLEGEQHIVIDSPAQSVSRITLNRPDKRNALNHEVRAQLFEALQLNDQNPDVHVTIIRGSGKAFCAGYDLDMKRNVPMPFFEAEGEGKFQRHVLAGWFMMMDLAKPVIAQVHGHCLAGGSELAAACDLVYCADNAKIGYPAVRSMGLPDMQIFPWLMGMRKAMQLMLTGDTMSGIEAVEFGWANGSVPEAELDAHVLGVAQRVAKIPPDLLAYNKRSVHRAMEVQGMRNALRYGSDLATLSTHAPNVKSFMRGFTGRGNSARRQFSKRDSNFGDGRTAARGNGAKSKL